MSTTTIVIIVTVILIIYWIFIKDGAFKQGVGELRNGNPVDASQSFHKAIRKNPKHYRAEFHLGLAYKDQADLFDPNNSNYLKFKKEAIKHCIRSSEINPTFAKPNNLVEYLISSEKNEEYHQDLLDYAKTQIDTSNSNLKNEFSWIYNV